MKVNVFTQTGTKASSVDLSDVVFDHAWNANMIHDVIIGLQSNLRRGTAHTKSRAEVRGGGKKPWRQKGTGRARHGSTRSPIWVGGGVSHGPRNEKNYQKKINKKVRAQALYAMLTRKYAHNEIVFVDALTFETPKTSQAQSVFATIARSAENEWMMRDRNATLIVLPEQNDTIARSYANVPNVRVRPAGAISALDIALHCTIMIVDPEAVTDVLLTRAAAPAQIATSASAA